MSRLNLKYKYLGFSLVFSEERSVLSLTDISRRLQINKTTTLWLLSTLETLGYLQRDQQTKLYRPALGILRLGFVALSGVEVRQVAMPYLQQLAEDVEETVNLAVLDKQEVIYIDRIGSKRMINVYRSIGARLPLYCTSTGKALFAFLPEEQLEPALVLSQLKNDGIVDESKEVQNSFWCVK